MTSATRDRGRRRWASATAPTGATPVFAVVALGAVTGAVAGVLGLVLHAVIGRQIGALSPLNERVGADVTQKNNMQQADGGGVR